MPHKDPEAQRAYRRRWRQQNLERERERSRAYYQRAKNKVLARTGRYQRDNREKANDYSRQWKARNLAKVRARTKAHQQANPELWAAYAKRWRKQNPDKARAIRRLGTREYYARKRGKPAWVDRQALLTVYRACPDGCHVDHIVPLGGPKRPALTHEGYPISGLHVPWNLQYLSQIANQKKQRRMSKDEVAICETFTSIY